MTNEDKILELLMGMQKDIVGLKQDVGGVKQQVDRLEVKVDRLDVKLDKLADTQVADVYALAKMTHDKTVKMDNKLNILNTRLFDQEAELQSFKVAK